jgi:EmrB/QacA subfamily drug resistance transporter
MDGVGQPTPADEPRPVAVESGAADVDGDGAELDPRRWLTLGILILTVVLIALDTSVLNVSIPTILRDLHTTVPALQWVITGYSLTFATLLIIGGRLGDIYGHRRLFIIGTTMFGLGSLLASVSHSVGVLILGEAVIEGIGAALMTPSTLAILSTTFKGRERAKAFAAWGAAAGAAVAFGPVLGGFLTTNYSWRWSFRINVVVAPIAAIGALLLMKNGKRAVRTPIDLPGAALIASGMFLFVFGLSDGGTYGWLQPIQDFSVAGSRIWPMSMPISIVPVAMVVAVGLLAGFVQLERWKERRQANPLFDFSLMHLKSFRYGLLTILILAMGQLGLLFALPLFLQDAVHLSAQENGLWLLPLGIFVIIGAQLGGRLTRRFALGSIIGCGLAFETIALLLVIWAVAPGITFWDIGPGLSMFGIGLGLASSQLTSVILSEINSEKSGVASGASSTARQMGGAFGAAIIGSLITVQTTNRAVSALGRSSITAPVRAQAIASMRELGPNFRPANALSAADAAIVERILTQALASASRTALLFAMGVVFIGALLSTLIPRIRPSVIKSASEVTIETFEAFEPMDIDAARL